MMKFNTSRNDFKKHFANVKALVTQMIRQGEAGTLFNKFCDKIQALKEDTGLVLYAAPGRFALLEQTEQAKVSPKLYRTITRCWYAQSPGKGAYAFKIKTGRELIFTVICNQLSHLGLDSYHCDVTSVTRDEEELGSTSFEVSRSMLQLQPA